MDLINSVIAQLQSVLTLMAQRDATSADPANLNQQIGALLVKAQSDLSIAAASTVVAGSGNIIVD